MMRRDAVLACVRNGMSGVGFKILLDLFATSPRPLRFRELPYTFRERHSGQSKLDANVGWEYLLMLLDRLFGGVVPIRFLAFSLIGALGLGVHMAALALLLKGLGMGFVAAQTAATGGNAERQAGGGLPEVGVGAGQGAAHDDDLGLFRGDAATTTGIVSNFNE